MKTKIDDVGFWKLTPSQVLGKDARDVVQASEIAEVTERVVLLPEMVQKAKYESLNSVGHFVRSLVNSSCQLEELYSKNVCGRSGKQQIPTYKTEAIRVEVHKNFPVHPSEERKQWAECIKIIDKHNLYMWNVINKKFDISEIKYYV